MQSDLDLLQKDSSQSSNVLSQKMKELEVQSKIMKEKNEKLESEVYKLNRDKVSNYYRIYKLI